MIMLISRLGALIGVAPVIAKAKFVSMSIEELWEIHQEISKLLEAKLLAEKKMLEQRLISLLPATAGRLRARRPYPPVLPKFANPDEPSQVWAGRGKRPRWVIEKLAAGLALEDLSIGRGSSVAMPEAHLFGAEKPPKATHKARSR
jgi:DNA-binding protein H-NS